MTVSLGLASRKENTVSVTCRKYLLPVREMGNALCTRMSPSSGGLSGLAGCTRMSRKRTPLFSWSFTLTAWQRTEGSAVWCVGELCVPGILSADRGVSFLSLLIHDCSLAEEKIARKQDLGRYTAVNSKRGSGERAVRTVER